VYRIEIDRSLCSGFGSCAELASRSFALGPDGIAVVHEGETDDDAVLEAAGSCPMGAIAVYDERGRQAA
jgi:ferredoxin